MTDERMILPMGLTPTERGYHVNAVSSGQSLKLVVFRRNEAAAAAAFPFPEEERTGDVWSMDLTREALFAAGLSDVDIKSAEYCFEGDGGRFEDPNGCAFSGRDSWGKAEQYGTPLRSPLNLPAFDWEEDCRPGIPWEDSVIYRLNVRSFTKSPTSGVVQKGTFAGVVEKIPYLKELGITAVELLPCQEYEELMFPAAPPGVPTEKTETESAAGRIADGKESERKRDGRVNCWGYVKARHLAPKASLCRKKPRDPAGEYRSMVKELHRAGIEVIQELYFDGSDDASCVTETLRFWVRFYHVDGIRLTGFADAEAAAKDPYLAGIKLIAQYWEDRPRPGRKRLASCNDNFLRDMRRALKGDEGMLNAMVFHTKNNPSHAAAVNYMADTNGFTMKDMVSYDRKHNEANGEANADGTDANFSWNCGVEGPTRKRKILELRHQQLRNAFLLLLLSQGTPQILSGDEFGNSQEGNNNAWCQDNAVWWLNWKQVKSEAMLLEFVKHAIAFRKRHRVFHLPEQPRVLDPKATGLPDVSYHGSRAWQPDFESWSRQLGILYNGRYAPDETGQADSSLYVMYNMHWEPHRFALPHPEQGHRWHVAADTAAAQVNGFYPEGEEPALPEEETLYEAPPRSIVVLIAKKVPEKIARKSGGETAGPRHHNRKSGTVK